MTCFWRHRWTKWEQYEWRGLIYARVLTPGEPKQCSEMRQKRTCQDCGKMQDELVRNG